MPTPTSKKGATVAAKQQVAQCIKNKGSLTELTQGMKSATVASKAAAVGMNLLATAGNMIAFMAISKGIELLVNAIDEYIHAAEIAREKSSELTDSWVEENSSIDDSISNFIELNLSGIPCLLMDSENNKSWGPIGRVYDLKYDTIVNTYNEFMENYFNNFKFIVDEITRH